MMPAAEVVDRFGYYACDRAGFESVWVQFKPSGYPFGLRRKWLADQNEKSTIETVLGCIAAWHMPDVNGAAVMLPDGPRLVDLVDAVDIAVITWLIQIFATWLLRDVGRPPKTSLPPSADTLQPTADLQMN